MSDGQDFSLNARRSSRVPVRMPVRVHIREPNGTLQPFPAWTIIVNRHGAKMECQREFALNEEVVIQVPSRGKSGPAKVVWKESKANERGYFEFAVDLDRPGNLWGVQFPPEDWKYEPRGPRAGLPSPEAPPLAVNEQLPFSITQDRVVEENFAAEASDKTPEKAPTTAPGFDFTAEPPEHSSHAMEQLPKEGLRPSDNPSPTTLLGIVSLPLELSDPDHRPAVEASRQSEAEPNAALTNTRPEGPSVWKTGQGTTTGPRAHMDFERVESSHEARQQEMTEWPRQLELRVADILASALSRWEGKVQDSLTSKCELLESHAATIVARTQQLFEENIRQLAQSAKQDASRLQQELAVQVKAIVQRQTLELAESNKVRLEQEMERMVAEALRRLHEGVQETLSALAAEFLNQWRAKAEGLLAARVDEASQAFLRNMEEVTQNVERLEQRAEATVRRCVDEFSQSCAWTLAEARAGLEAELTDTATRIHKGFSQRIADELNGEARRVVEQVRAAIEETREHNLQVLRKQLKGA